MTTQSLTNSLGTEWAECHAKVIHELYWYIYNNYDVLPGMVWQIIDQATVNWAEGDFATFLGSCQTNSLDPFFVLQLKSLTEWPDITALPQIIIGATISLNKGSDYRYGIYTGNTTRNFFVAIAPFGGWNGTSLQFDDEYAGRCTDDADFASGNTFSYKCCMNEYMLACQMWRTDGDLDRPRGWYIGRFLSNMPSSEDPLPLVYNTRDATVQTAHGWGSQYVASGDPMGRCYIRTMEGHWVLGNNQFRPGTSYDCPPINNTGLAQDETNWLCFPLQLWTPEEGGIGVYHGIVSDFLYVTSNSVPYRTETPPFISPAGYVM